MGRNAGIYKLTSPSGKCYIGQSGDLNRRISEYRNFKSQVKDQPGIYNALCKYGLDKFRIDILVYCSMDDELNWFEQYYIKQFRSNESKHGYNCTNGGESNPMKGKHWNENQKKVYRGSFKGRKHTEETKAKMRASNRRATKGKPLSDEHKLKISLSLTGRPNYGAGKGPRNAKGQFLKGNN